VVFLWRKNWKLNIFWITTLASRPVEMHREVVFPFSFQISMVLSPFPHRFCIFALQGNRSYHNLKGKRYPQDLKLSKRWFLLRLVLTYMIGQYLGTTDNKVSTSGKQTLCLPSLIAFMLRNRNLSVAVQAPCADTILSLTYYHLE